MHGVFSSNLYRCVCTRGLTLAGHLSVRGSADGILCPLQLDVFKPWVVFENAVAVYTQQDFFFGGNYHETK